MPRHARSLVLCAAHWIHPSVHSAVQHCVWHRESLARSENDGTLPQASPMVRVTNALAPDDITAELGKGIVTVEMAVAPGVSIQRG